jgi:aspartyl-tRNA(Asn)/glutamyl-tRNA(Gln) amidotransferase subunit A
MSASDLGVLEAAALLRGRQLSALELTDACLLAIDERNGGPPTFDGAPDAVNAWVRLYPELARESARAADQRRSREGDAAPRLCGIPLALKDLYGVAGLPLTASSRVLVDNVAAQDAIAWARLRDQGMVPLGHTHTHEFAAGGTTDQVGNPWALDRVAGGSSGGSAAALAARMAPAALGSDTCGSLRIPAACCGISTLKPTYGRIPLNGILPLAPSLDHPGPMARSLADCAALLGPMTAGRPQSTRATFAVAATPEPELAARNGPRPLEGMTIALTDRTAQVDVQQRVGAALDEAAGACERLGARVIELAAPWTFHWNDLSVILFTEAWRYHARHWDLHDRYRPAIAEFLEVARKFTATPPYLAAQERRARGGAIWERWFESGDVDLILEPTLPIVPYGRGPGYDRGHAGGPGDPMISLTALWDVTGMPVASLPVNWEVGVSMIAPRGQEATLIQAAIDLQEHALGVPEWPDRSESRIARAIRLTAGPGAARAAPRR